MNSIVNDILSWPEIQDEDQFAYLSSYLSSQCPSSSSSLPDCIIEETLQDEQFVNMDEIQEGSKSVDKNTVEHSEEEIDDGAENTMIFDQWTFTQDEQSVKSEEIEEGSAEEDIVEDSEKEIEESSEDSEPILTLIASMVCNKPKRGNSGIIETPIQYNLMRDKLNVIKIHECNCPGMFVSMSHTHPQYAWEPIDGRKAEKKTARLKKKQVFNAWTKHGKEVNISLTTKRFGLLHGVLVQAADTINFECLISSDDMKKTTNSKEWKINVFPIHEELFLELHQAGFRRRREIELPMRNILQRFQTNIQVLVERRDPKKLKKDKRIGSPFEDWEWPQNISHQSYASDWCKIFKKMINRHEFINRIGKPSSESVKNLENFVKGLC